MCNKAITVLPATHTRTISAFTSQPQGITAIWLVLTLPTTEWTVRRGKCLTLGIEPVYGHSS